jgi:hypothetical protein
VSGPSAQYSAIALCLSVSPALSARSSAAWPGSRVRGGAAAPAAAAPSRPPARRAPPGPSGGPGSAVRPHRGGQRLPAVGVEQPHQLVDRPVAGPVGVRLGQPAGTAAEVAELVGPVAVAEGEHRPGGQDADGARRALGPDGVGVVAEPDQQPGEAGRLGGEQVDQGPVGGEAGRLPPGRLGPVGRRPAHPVPEAAPEGDLVVGRPGVVHGRVQDMQGPGHDRGAHAGPADGLERGGVPGQGDVVAHDRLLPVAAGSHHSCAAARFRPVRVISGHPWRFRCRGEATLLWSLTTVR